MGAAEYLINLMSIPFVCNLIQFFLNDMHKTEPQTIPEDFNYKMSVLII